MNTIIDHPTLVEAIAQENNEEILKILASGVSPNTISKDRVGRKEAPLIIALRTQNLTTCRNLIKAGADINRDGFLNKPPLWYAAKTRNLATIKLLLENKAKVNLSARRNPINLLSRFIHSEIDEIWYIDGPALFAIESCYKASTRKSNLEIITELASAGAHLD